MKQDYPALLDPGLKNMDLAGLEDLCVTSFSNNARRRQIWERFILFLDRLSSTGLDYEIWIDGSFVTEKEAPSDVDVVVFHDPPEVNRLSANRKATLDLLFMDRQVTKLRYHTDAFFIPNDDPDARMYWRGCFGFDHYDNPKGIVRLDLRTP